MTQEEKELLLKDLSARLPYGVICTDNRHGASKVTEVDIVSEVIYLFDVDEYVEIKNCKPYLRPMSSMTEEEKKEFCKIEGRLNFPCKHIKLTFSVDEFDWLNAHHFDYRGLIEKGLALEAPEDMYNIKQK